MSNEGDFDKRSGKTIYCGPTAAHKWHNRMIAKATSLPKKAFNALRAKFDKTKEEHKGQDPSRSATPKSGPVPRTPDHLSFGVLDNGSEPWRTPTAPRGRTIQFDSGCSGSGISSKTSLSSRTSRSTSSNIGVALTPSTSFGGRSVTSAGSEAARAPEIDPASLGIAMPRSDANGRTILSHHHRHHEQQLPRRPPPVVRRGHEPTHLPPHPSRSEHHGNIPASYDSSLHSCALRRSGAVRRPPPVVRRGHEPTHLPPHHGNIPASYDSSLHSCASRRSGAVRRPPPAVRRGNEPTHLPPHPLRSEHHGNIPASYDSSLQWCALRRRGAVRRRRGTSGEGHASPNVSAK